MHTLKEYSEIVNDWIRDYRLPSTPIGLYEPITYMLAGGGKRLRPTLLCATAEAYGYPLDKVKSQAVAIEMFHNFTLLHDDLMDRADVRHGVPTVHRKWNDCTAILSGDTMLTLSSMAMSLSDSQYLSDVMMLFNKTAIEVYEGQQMDMNFETLESVAEAEYIEMIRLKTSVLLGCATRIGAMLAGAPMKNCESIYAFAIDMGLAFQLRDDYLDTFGNSSTFGKAIGGDIMNNKKTWLWVDANAHAPERVKNTYAIDNQAEKIKCVTAMYVDLGCDARCMERIEAYTRRAIAHLEDCGLDAESYDFFKTLALKAITRVS